MPLLFDKVGGMKHTLKDLIAAANTAITGKLPLIGAANSVVDLGEGWYRVPYGSYPHSKGLQVFEEDDGQNVVDAFNEYRSKNPTFEAPIYIGHPDVPEMKDEFTDTSAYGWIDELAANVDGFDFHVNWNPDGTELVANRKYRYFSPYWLLVRGANAGRKVIRPVFLKSVGLTNEPNIGGCWLANEKTNPEENDMDLLARLRAILNKPDLTEDEMVALLQKMADALKKIREASQDKWVIEDVAWEVAENEQLADNLIALLAKQDADLSAANTAAQVGLGQQITELETALTAANTAHATRVVTLAIEGGKVLPADKEMQIQSLVSAEDLDSAANTLLTREKVISTTPKTKGIQPQDLTAHQKRDKQIAAANTIQGEMPGLTHLQAWKRAEDDERFAGLFKPSAAE